MPNKAFNPLNWWVKHEHRFPNIGLLACEVMGIMGSQIETKRIFNTSVEIITSLRCFHLGINFFYTLILIMKN
jgi:hypothetical protein